MAKHTYMIAGLSLAQVTQVDAFLNGAGETVVVAVAAAPAAVVVQPAPPAPAMPGMPAAAPPMPVAVVAAAPALPVAAAPAAPAAVSGARTVLMALSELTAKKGAAVGKGLVQTYTNTYPDGDPKKGSAKFADIHPAHAEAFIAAADAMAAG